METRYENLRHKEAFEFYYALGPDRTLDAVADKFGVTLSTVQHWSHFFSWRERLTDRDNEIARRYAEESMREAVKNRIEYSKLIQRLMQRAEEKFRNHELEPQTITDVVRLVQLEIQLAESTDELVKRVDSTGRTLVREMTLREVIGDEYDEQLARRIAETIVGYTQHTQTEPQDS